ncbi:MAG: methionyl-tRNA formyltransferase [Bacteroidota bacterium]
MSADLKIVFLGTPDFAAASLKAILDAKFNVVAVVTVADKPQGRGKKTGMSAVKELALSHKLPVLQPSNLKSEDFRAQLKAFQADIQVVVAFRMLPESVWSMPRLGTFNLHASLLPDYRGAAPINWAIINGETKTGVTTFFLRHEIDTGEIILQEEVEIMPSDDFGSLYHSLMEKGSDLVVRTLIAVQNKQVKTTPQQDVSSGKLAPKIFKPDCEIDWNVSVQEAHNFIRGLSPVPCAWTKLDGKVFKVLKSRMTAEKSTAKPGTFILKDKKTLHVACADYMLSLTEVQLEGKKRMNIADFLAGYQFKSEKEK